MDRRARLASTRQMELAETHTSASTMVAIQLQASRPKLPNQVHSAVLSKTSWELQPWQEEVKAVAVQQRDCITMSMAQEEIPTFTRIMVAS